MNRPPHIDPRWWQRASWAARQAAVDAHNREQRHIATLKARVEEARREHERRYHSGEPPATPEQARAARIDAIRARLAEGIDPVQIAKLDGASLAGITRFLQRNNLHDVANVFARAEWALRKKPCAGGCGALVSRKRCHSCAVREVARRRRELKQQAAA